LLSLQIGWPAAGHTASRFSAPRPREPNEGGELVAERGKEQTERIRKEFEDKAKGETRQLDPAKAPRERHAAGKPEEGPDVRQAVRRKAKESTA
jgi:hypothetical protein